MDEMIEAFRAGEKRRKTGKCEMLPRFAIYSKICNGNIICTVIENVLRNFRKLLARM